MWMFCLAKMCCIFKAYYILHPMQVVTMFALSRNNVEQSFYSLSKSSVRMSLCMALDGSPIAAMIVLSMVFGCQGFHCTILDHWLGMIRCQAFLRRDHHVVQEKIAGFHCADKRIQVLCHNTSHTPAEDVMMKKFTFKILLIAVGLCSFSEICKKLYYHVMLCNL